LTTIKAFFITIFSKNKPTNDRQHVTLFMYVVYLQNVN